MNADDHQMEEMLKRYRPKGPGPALRQRVLGDTRGVASSGHANWPLRVAATIALVAGLAGALWWQKDRSRVPVDEPPADHIEFSIQRVGEAAQLLAAADILAAQPGAERMARRAYTRIASFYAGSPSAQEAKKRLSSLDERSVTP